VYVCIASHRNRHDRQGYHSNSARIFFSLLCSFSFSSSQSLFPHVPFLILLFYSCLRRWQPALSAPKYERSSVLNHCVEAIGILMSSNRLKLNKDKTRLIWVSTNNSLQSLPSRGIPLTLNIVITDIVHVITVLVTPDLSVSALVTQWCYVCRCICDFLHGLL